MHIVLGWRNIWRNPRRTMVILAAVVIGVWSMVFLGALMRGLSDQLIQNGISTLTGHLQIHHREFREDPVVRNRIQDTERVRSVLKELLPEGAVWAERIRVDAVANNARHTWGVTLVGMDPEQEARVSFIGDAVSRGAYLEPGDDYGILVGRALAERFETRPGRRLVLMSSDAHGDVASSAFEIRGIYRAGLEATEERFVFVTRESAREMLGLETGITEAAVLLPSHDQAEAAAGAVRAKLPEHLSVETWKELLPLVRVSLELYDGFIFIWFIAVFIAMAFGIVNTLLMAVFERMREFGLLKSLGMKPLRIVKAVLMESFLLLLLGTAAGDALGFLSVAALSGPGLDLSSLAAGLEYAGMPRIIYPVIDAWDFVLANAVVLVIGLIVSLYPALKAGRFTPVAALSHT